MLPFWKKKKMMMSPTLGLIPVAIQGCVPVIFFFFKKFHRTCSNLEKVSFTTKKVMLLNFYFEHGVVSVCEKRNLIFRAFDSSSFWLACWFRKVDCYIGTNKSSYTRNKRAAYSISHCHVHNDTHSQQLLDRMPGFIKWLRPTKICYETVDGMKPLSDLTYLMTSHILVFSSSYLVSLFFFSIDICCC